MYIRLPFIYVGKTCIYSFGILLSFRLPHALNQPFYFTGTLCPIICYFENASNYSRKGICGWGLGSPHI